MSGIRITQLPEKTSALDTGDFFVTDDGTAAEKVDFDTFAESIIETYNDSSLGGTAQTVKDALDTTMSELFTLKSATCNFVSPFALYGQSSGGSTTVYKWGKLVFLRGIATPVTSIAGSQTGTVMFTLPSGYRPKDQCYTLCQGSGQNYWFMSILTNGEVYFSRYRNGDSYNTCPATAYLPFTICFLTD